jgi:hypothetical protein
MISSDLCFLTSWNRRSGAYKSTLGENNNSEFLPEIKHEITTFASITSFMIYLR